MLELEILNAESEYVMPKALLQGVLDFPSHVCHSLCGIELRSFVQFFDLWADNSADAGDVSLHRYSHRIGTKPRLNQTPLLLLARWFEASSHHIMLVPALM
jgi:hypothetical protein